MALRSLFNRGARRWPLPNRRTPSFASSLLRLEELEARLVPSLTLCEFV
jgi:hypothetical protein